MVTIYIGNLLHMFIGTYTPSSVSFIGGGNRSYCEKSILLPQVLTDKFYHICLSGTPHNVRESISQL